MCEKENPNSHSALLDGKYELGRVLGHGTFAKVYHAKNLNTGKNVAMKVVGKEKVIKVGMIEQIKREISVMKMVKHPNIVQLHEVMASKSKIYIAMELVRGGELFNKIVKGRLKEDVVRVYFQQLISAVDFCHSRGVYHRDLKPENLLLDEDGNLKVSDFGLCTFSEHLRQDGLLHTTCGTPAYVSPEVIAKKGYDGAKADIWSCGVILYVLLAGFLPFQDDNLVAMYKKPVPKSIAMRKKEKEEEEDKVFEFMECEKSSTTMNAFHIISLSEGFDLSPLFEEKKREEREEMRFATGGTPSRVISKLEQVAKAVKFDVKSSDTKVRLQGQERGRKGKLAIAADIYAVTPSFLVVEVKKDKGDTLEYNQFCSKELRPALKDIFWTSADPPAA
uniref:non-specific serine/threonine protein kinase n=1 Tax=Medicago truncatula TaxID=3880 RepID=B7FIU3_MEDTR|nr:unknown [Medicago truncatula]AFK33832.1 unknown [Medicago truncatula]